MKPLEREVCKLLIYCMTEDCMNPRGGHKSSHRNVRDFSEKSKQEAIESFQTGIKINSTNANPTQPRWKRTKKGWLCPECK